MLDVLAGREKCNGKEKLSVITFSSCDLGTHFYLHPKTVAFIVDRSVFPEQRARGTKS